MARVPLYSAVHHYLFSEPQPKKRRATARWVREYSIRIACGPRWRDSGDSGPFGAGAGSLLGVGRESVQPTPIVGCQP